MNAERFDFHLHTSCSDGALAPSAVLAEAARAGLAGVSITDHDTADAYRELEAGAKRAGLPRVLPGIEVSAACDGTEIHILGYFPGGFPDGLGAMVERLLEEREERIREGILRLATKGMVLDWQDVMAEAAGRVVSRGHMAQALVKKRLLPNIYAAFPDILGPETVRVPRAEGREVVSQISRLGGVAVWAHPSPQLLDRFLAWLIEAGLAGVEILTPRRRSSERRKVEERIAGRGLLVSGGSDWHGHDVRQPLGRFTVGRSEVGGFLERIGWR
jgi:predicted metal-dependent phosphoesterase TrpH